MIKRVLTKSTQLSLATSNCFASAEPKLPPLDYTPPKYEGPSYDDLLALRQQYMSPGYFHYFAPEKPFQIYTGYKQYVYDQNGKRYLDGLAGIATVNIGHNHPVWLKMVKSQLDKMAHSGTLYMHDQICQYAQELTSTLPGDLKCCYFTNSGSEAIDLAQTLARSYTTNFETLSLRNGYHGTSAQSLGYTALKSWRYTHVPLGIGVRYVVNPDPYRGHHGNDGPKYAKDVLDCIDTTTSGKIASFLAEPVQGVGGCVKLADGFLKDTYKYVRNAEGLCISDEVQTGFCRTGDSFWGFESHGVVPDIITFAKAAGNGIPLGGVIATPKIMKHLASKVYYNTYGGNPVSMAAGRAVLKVLKEEGLQENSKVVGTYLREKLQKLMEKKQIIGDVRGQGMAVGIEFVKDRNTKEPITKATYDKIFNKCRDLGFMGGKAGLFGNVLRVYPPLCFTKEDADFAVDCIDRATEGI